MRYALIGEKLGHSYSPQIHALLGNAEYELKEIAPENLPAFLREKQFCGLNVTIPYKRDVVPFCDELSDTARETGCVNTLVVRKDGTLYGHNTDIGGFIQMLRSAEIDPCGKKAVILGSGGTSLTASSALKRLNAAEIHVVSRSGALNYGNLAALHGDAQIIVNASPAGMYPNNGECLVNLADFPALEGVADVVYNPEKTALILQAEARGVPCVSGLEMLAAQAREAEEAFMGREIPPEIDRAVVGEIKFSTLNLILVGMPGCGKSSLGRLTAKRLGRRFIDLDQEIALRAGKSIPEIFQTDGEARFREMETQAMQAFGKLSGAVIATGGGAILRDENVRAMRQNGRVCFVRRALEALPRDGRPLSASESAVERLWRERREKYLAASDFTIENNDALQAVAQRIAEGFYEAAHH